MEKKSEYFVLNNQVLEYERYAFERVFFIGFLGIIGIGVVKGSTLFSFVPFLTIVVLIFNYLHTHTRLEQSFQLRAYLQLTAQKPEKLINWFDYQRFRSDYLKSNKKVVSKILAKRKQNTSVETKLLRRSKYLSFIFVFVYVFITFYSGYFLEIQEILFSQYFLYLNYLTISIGILALIDMMFTRYSTSESEYEIGEKVFDIHS